jgi:hypothetical protein
MAKRQLNLTAIERSLRAVQREFPRINEQLKTRRETLDDEVVENMMAGYHLVDSSVRRDCEVFAMGQLKCLLDFNNAVLCGMDKKKSKEHARHVAATKQHFYDHDKGGIGAIVEWYAGHREASPWRQAAGVYVRTLSEPQLFIEGNHRSGALIMSYLLARAGKPPFVLTVDNAKAYFDPSTLIKDTKKTTITRLFKLPRIDKNFAQFLKRQADPRYLL